MKSFFKNFLFYFTPFFDAVCFFLFFLSIVLLIKINLYKGFINPEGLKNYNLEKLSEIPSPKKTANLKSWDRLDEKTSSRSIQKLQRILKLQENANMAHLSQEQENTWPGIMYLDRG